MVTIDIAPYDPEWPGHFAEIGASLREALRPVLGERLTGLHHIGSTSVEGLAAKPIIDVQVSIRDFRPWRRTDLPAPERPAENPSREHIGEEEALLDAITANDLRWLGDWCWDRRKWLFARYEDLKRDLAAREWPSVDGYSDAKGDFVWATLRAADGWNMNDHRPTPFDA